MKALFDVVEIAMNSPHKVRVLNVLLGLRQANELVAKESANSNGQHTFAAVHAGQYRDGDIYGFVQEACCA